MFRYFFNLSNLDFRLRDGIKAYPKNWSKNCTMCVQDLVTSYINITDGISNEAATNFQDMCKRFSTKIPKSHNK